MAFGNNFFPTNYQSMYPAQPNTFPTHSGIIWVQGENAAKSYPIAPNSSVPLWDSEAQVIYIKSADMSGMPSMRIIDYTIRDTAQKSPEIASQSDFATKDDISILKNEINELKAKLSRFEEVESNG